MQNETVIVFRLISTNVGWGRNNIRMREFSMEILIWPDFFLERVNFIQIRPTNHCVGHTI